MDATLERARRTTVGVATAGALASVAAAGTAVAVLLLRTTAVAVALLGLSAALALALAVAVAFARAEVFPGVRDDVDLGNDRAVLLLVEVGEAVAHDQHAAAGVETVHRLLGELEDGHVRDREELVVALLLVQADAEFHVFGAAIVLCVVHLGIREQIPGERGLQHSATSVVK